MKACILCSFEHVYNLMSAGMKIKFHSAMNERANAEQSQRSAAATESRVWTVFITDLSPSRQHYE